MSVASGGPDGVARATRARLLLHVLFPLSLGLWAAWLALSLLRPTLVRLTFQAGWGLLVALLAVALAWRRPPGRLRRALRVQLAVGGLLVALFSLHVGFRLPQGGLVETALAGSFSSLLLSNGVGALLVFRGGADATLARWLRLHVVLTWVLLALGVFHGAFVHMHGAMAHYAHAALG